MVIFPARSAGRERERLYFYKMEGIVNKNLSIWDIHNIIVWNCLTVLMCGKRLGQPWSHLTKLIALKMYKPLKKADVINYLKGKECHIHPHMVFSRFHDNYLYCTVGPQQWLEFRHRLCDCCFFPIENHPYFLKCIRCYFRK